VTAIFRVEWWDDASRFALIIYSLNGREQEFGLRLDTDKRILVDHFDDPIIDQAIQEWVLPIWKIVAQHRMITDALRDTGAETTLKDNSDVI